MLLNEEKGNESGNEKGNKKGNEKGNEFNFLNEEAEEFSGRWSQTLYFY